MNQFNLIPLVSAARIEIIELAAPLFGGRAIARRQDPFLIVVKSDVRQQPARKNNQSASPAAAQRRRETNPQKLLGRFNSKLNALRTARQHLPTQSCSNHFD
jgi:hypothetical protein